MVSRRGVIAIAAAMAASGASARAGTSADGLQILRARKVNLFLMGPDRPPTAAWSFSEKGTPAILRARQGAEFKVRIVNEIGEDLWLHWFGVRGPSELMTVNVMPGPDNAVECVFTPPDAGTFWLGPMANVSRIRDMGLGAMFIVEEHEPLPVLADLPLILDDWMIDDDGVMDTSFGDMNAVVGEGRLGNWFTANNRFRPSVDLPAKAYGRLRLLNAANARIMNLQFKGDDPLVIALDGQPVPLSNLGSQALTLAPGQRADLLVQGRDGDTRMAMNVLGDVVELMTLLAAPQTSLPEIPDNFALPANPLAAEPDWQSATVVPLVIEGGEKGGLKGALYGGEMKDMRSLLEAGMAWAFNGVAGAGGPPLGTFVKGAAVVLAVENRTTFDQPLHIHGHVWREIGRSGQPVEVSPWRDTALVAAGRTLKLGFVADNPGTWAIQSLVAERADAGLLAAFVVA